MDTNNYWIDLRDYLKRKWIAPQRHPTFWLYLVIAIVGAGGLGIWDALVGGEQKEIVASLYTYFPAIAMASAFELILPPESKKFVRSFAIAAASILCVLAIAMVLRPPDSKSLIMGVAGYFLSIALWWIANAENPNLLDTPPAPTAVMGGDNKPTGNLDGFTS